MTAPGFDRGANLLGALSLALSDRISDAISAAAEQSERPGSETAAEALSALHHFLVERDTAPDPVDNPAGSFTSAQRSYAYLSRLRVRGGRR